MSAPDLSVKARLLLEEVMVSAHDLLAELRVTPKLRVDQELVDAIKKAATILEAATERCDGLRDADAEVRS